MPAEGIMFLMRNCYFSLNCPAFFLKRQTVRLCRRMPFRREAVTQSQSQRKKERQCKKRARQVIAVPCSRGVTSQNRCVPAGSSPGARSCASCQQPNLEVLVQRRCCQRSQERLAEDDCHLWCVEVIASSMPERRS